MLSSGENHYLEAQKKENLGSFSALWTNHRSWNSTVPTWNGAGTEPATESTAMAMTYRRLSCPLPQGPSGCVVEPIYSATAFKHLNYSLLSISAELWSPHTNLHILKRPGVLYLAVKTQIVRCIPLSWRHVRAPAVYARFTCSPPSRVFVCTSALTAPALFA